MQRERTRREVVVGQTGSLRSDEQMLAVGRSSDHAHGHRRRAAVGRRAAPPRRRVRIADACDEAIHPVLLRAGPQGARAVHVQREHVVVPKPCVLRCMWRTTRRSVEAANATFPGADPRDALVVLHHIEHRVGVQIRGVRRSGRTCRSTHRTRSTRRRPSPPSRRLADSAKARNVEVEAGRTPGTAW
jgi:hypothetical protein